MKLEFQEYHPRKIVNVHKHVDGPWFWNKYSAYPYVGCRSGCEFCYLRGSRYLGRRDPNTFDTLVQVKTNAVELLEKELSKLEPDVVNCGDWQQPAEDQYMLSRQMLKVIDSLGFPLFIVERSPLVTRDLDILEEINRKAWVCVAFSISSLDDKLKHAFEPHSPGVRLRLKAMAELASKNILVGTTLMPVIPNAGDDLDHLEEVIRATKDFGGTFVLGGSMTIDGEQAERTLAAAHKFSPELEADFREFYKLESDIVPRYTSPPRSYIAKLGRSIRDLCIKHGLKDRIPRFIPSNHLGINKFVAEQLFLKAYELELQEAQSYRVWAYRKAAWTIDEYPHSIAETYQKLGRNGLLELPNVGDRIAKEVISYLS